ncbi:hypothetical protein TrCOL_g563 [Triparma columacea]|uniref:peptidylprolyl isomerase n=1 Tax=Triparma columacea TaxID=722753 RepID=A0A9W7LE01_9STRA|nr:hypothetical protein TrCOL_g563 [Triparma columacea]
MGYVRLFALIMGLLGTAEGLGTPITKDGRLVSACEGVNLPSDASLGNLILDGEVQCREDMKITVGDHVEVEFRAYRYDTCEAFDLTAKDETFTFQLGKQEVVRGWEVGLLGACKGQKRKLTVASDMGFGDDAISFDGGRTEIAGGTTLVYEINIVDVEKGELPSAHIEVDPEVEEALRREKKEKRPWKFNSPRTHKDRMKNLKMSNHVEARRGLQMERRRVEEIDRRRRLLKVEKEGAGGGRMGGEAGRGL